MFLSLGLLIAITFQILRLCMLRYSPHPTSHGKKAPLRGGELHFAKICAPSIALLLLPSTLSRFLQSQQSHSSRSCRISPGCAYQHPWPQLITANNDFRNRLLHPAKSLGIHATGSRSRAEITSETYELSRRSSPGQCQDKLHPRIRLYARMRRQHPCRTMLLHEIGRGS